jgi:hypothetical protein
MKPISAALPKLDLGRNYSITTPTLRERHLTATASRLIIPISLF